MNIKFALHVLTYLCSYWYITLYIKQIHNETKLLITKCECTPIKAAHSNVLHGNILTDSDCTRAKIRNINQYIKNIVIVGCFFLYLCTFITTGRPNKNS